MARYFPKIVFLTLSLLCMIRSDSCDFNEKIEHTRMYATSRLDCTRHLYITGKHRSKRRGYSLTNPESPSRENCDGSNLNPYTMVSLRNVFLSLLKLPFLQSSVQDVKREDKSPHYSKNHAEARNW